jgi:hypothetical protein
LKKHEKASKEKSRHYLIIFPGTGTRVMAGEELPENKKAALEAAL